MGIAVVTVIGIKKVLKWGETVQVQEREGALC